MQSEVSTIFKVTKFLTKNAPKMLQTFSDMCFMGPKEIPPNFPQDLPENYQEKLTDELQ